MSIGRYCSYLPLQTHQPSLIITDQRFQNGGRSTADDILFTPNYLKEENNITLLLLLYLHVYKNIMCIILLWLIPLDIPYTYI